MKYFVWNALIKSDLWVRRLIVELSHAWTSSKNTLHQNDKTLTAFKINLFLGGSTCFVISGRTNPITASVWLGIKAGYAALLSIQICVPLQEQKELTDAKRKHLGKETEKAKHLASSF